MELTRGERLQIMLTEDERKRWTTGALPAACPAGPPRYANCSAWGCLEGGVTMDGKSKSEDFGVTDGKTAKSNGDDAEDPRATGLSAFPRRRRQLHDLPDCEGA